MGAPGALEGAQASGVVQGAISWTREARDDGKHSSSDTWHPGTEGGNLTRAARHMLRASGLVSPSPVLLHIFNIKSLP